MVRVMRQGGSLAKTIKSDRPEANCEHPSDLDHQRSSLITLIAAEDRIREIVAASIDPVSLIKSEILAGRATVLAEHVSPTLNNKATFISYNIDQIRLHKVGTEYGKLIRLMPSFFAFPTKSSDEFRRDWAAGELRGKLPDRTPVIAKGCRIWALDLEHLKSRLRVSEVALKPFKTVPKRGRPREGVWDQFIAELVAVALEGKLDLGMSTPRTLQLIEDRLMDAGKWHNPGERGGLNDERLREVVEAVKLRITPKQ